jgi:pimeloyl-ACP methyl ester carboxylesterase
VVPEALVEQTSLALKHVEPRFGQGPLFSAPDLARLKVPVLVVAGGRDLIHPGDRVAARAREVLPTLRELILVPETGHIHFEAPGGPVMKRIAGDGFSRERVAGRGVQRLSGGGGDR